MKAVLVLDEMPVTCSVCPLLASVKFDYYYDESICTATGNAVLHTTEGVHRMCPLKEMPEERILPSSKVNNTNYGEEPWFSDGWNACLEELKR